VIAWQRIGQSLMMGPDEGNKIGPGEHIGSPDRHSFFSGQIPHLKIRPSTIYAAQANSAPVT
jgi:hypothetical protein